MKPSQVPNRLSHPSPRRVLPLHTPGKERFHPHLHHSGGVAPNNPPNADTPLSTETGPPKDCVEPRGLVPSSLSSSCSTVSPCYGTERERKGSFQRSSLSESKHHSSSQPVPVTLNNRGLADVPSSGCSQRSSSQCLHNVKERLSSGQSVKHQETESKFATSASSDTQRRHDPFKVLLLFVLLWFFHCPRLDETLILIVSNMNLELFLEHASRFLHGSCMNETWRQAQKKRL